ncbi:MAG: DUF115 domain-containing protein [Nitrospinaceae bacterium]|nr:DUF115 domain-containing protein [Nitrospinaceae bacterium]
MNQFFARNMELLKKHSPSSKNLTKTLPSSIKVQITPSGENTVRLNNILIHSMYDPVKEGRSFSKKVTNGSQVCLYGFGLGYHIESLLEKIGPDGFILAIELNADLLNAAMILRNQSKLLLDKRIHIVYGLNEAIVATEITQYMEKMQSTNTKNFQVIFHSPSFKCIPSSFPKLTNSLEVLLMERRFPAVLGDIEKENYILNKEIVSQSSGINCNHSKHKDKPVLLVSAGPSLDDIIPYLKMVNKKFILACVDTAFPILSREGIDTDYVFSLDPQEDSFQYFQDHLDSSTTLIFTPSANTKVVHSYKGKKFVVYKKTSSQFTEEKSVINAKGSTQSGGSVSCLALDVLIQFGCDPIFLTGQDLSFPSSRTYSSFSNNNKQMLDKLDSAYSLKGSHKSDSIRQKTVNVKNIVGDNVVTNQAMYSYIRGIEEIAAVNPKIKIYNLCSHGAKINKVIPLGSVNELIKFLA